MLATTVVSKTFTKFGEGLYFFLTFTRSGEGFLFGKPSGECIQLYEDGRSNYHEPVHVKNEGTNLKLFIDIKRHFTIEKHKFKYWSVDV